jgi:general secretion pathway protein F
MQFRVRSVRPGEAAVDDRLVEGANEGALRLALTAAGQTVLSVRRVRSWRLPRNPQRKRFPLFCREVRTLIQAGMTVVEAVDTLAARERLQGHPAGLAAELLARLHQGQALSVALAGIPQTPPVLVAAVRAGERTSNLAEALDDYLRFHSLVEQLRRKVVSASIYPALVMALGLGISLFLLVVVMPNFARMYQNLRGSAAGMTAVMIDISQFVSSNRTEVFAGLLVVAGVLTWWVAGGRAKLAAVRLSQAVPWLRARVLDFQLAMMYQALALMLKGGYAMTEAMAVAGLSALSAQLKLALALAREQIERGGSVSQALAQAGLCDEVGRRLMSAAERNGNFHLAADTVSRLHGERFELFVERTTRIVEPVLLMLVALMVGTIVVMMYLPVFDMATRLR